METKRTESNSKKTKQGKAEKVPKTGAIYMRVSEDEEKMIDRLMLRHNKDKTSLILFALDKLRKREQDTASTSSVEAEFAQDVIVFLNKLATDPRIATKEAAGIKRLKSWAINLQTQSAEPPVAQQAPITPAPTVPIYGPDDDFIDVDEMIRELKFMEGKILALEKATYALPFSDYKKDALELITRITQSHDALKEAIS